MTGLANGQISVFYSPQTSLNGAKLLLNKGPPRKATIEDLSDAVAAPTILTPHALPMFRDGEMVGGTKRKREKDRMDPRKSKRPELPVTGPGRGGRVGASATQHVVQNLVRDTTRDEDVSSILITCAHRSFAGLCHDAFIYGICYHTISPSLLRDVRCIFPRTSSLARRYARELLVSGGFLSAVIFLFISHFLPVRGLTIDE